MRHVGNLGLFDESMGSFVKFVILQITDFTKLLTTEARLRKLNCMAALYNIDYGCICLAFFI
jgi:hypothetical protein